MMGQRDALWGGDKMLKCVPLSHMPKTKGTPDGAPVIFGGEGGFAPLPQVAVTPPH